MIVVIWHAVFPFDDLSDPHRRPPVGSVAVCGRTFEEQPRQPAPLHRPQLARPTWRTGDLQRIRTASLPSVIPTHHRTGRTVHPTPGFTERQAGFHQRQCPPAPPFQQIRATFRPRHVALSFQWKHSIPLQHRGSCGLVLRGGFPVFATGRIRTMMVSAWSGRGRVSSPGGD